MEDFHEGFQLKGKLEALQEHLKPGEDLLVILWVEKSSVDGNPYKGVGEPGGEKAQTDMKECSNPDGRKQTADERQKPEPVYEGRRVGYCRMMSLKTLLKSADQITQKWLDKWKHTVVPTRDNIHMEVMQRLFKRHPNVSAATAISLVSQPRRGPADQKVQVF